MLISPHPGLILVPTLLITASQDPFTTSVTITRPPRGACCDQDSAFLDRETIRRPQRVTERNDSSRPPVRLAKLAGLLVPPEAMQLIIARADSTAPASATAVAFPATFPKPTEPNSTVLRLPLGGGRRPVGPYETDQPRQMAPHEGLQHREAVAQDADVDLHRRPDRGRALRVEHIWVVDHYSIQSQLSKNQRSGFMPIR